MHQLQCCEDGSEPPQALGREERVQVLLVHPRGGLAEPVEDVRQGLAEGAGGGLAHVHCRVLGAAVVAAEEDRTREQRLFEEPLQLFQVPAQAHLLLGDERRLVPSLGAALLTGKDLAGAERPDGLPIDGAVQRGDPEERAPLPLAPGPSLGDRPLVLSAGLGKRQVERDVALAHQTVVQVEARFERLHVQEAVGRLRRPEPVHHLGVEPAHIPRLRCERRPLALPVVLGGGRDAIAVVPQPHHLRLLERGERAAHLRQTRVGVDRGVQRGGDVLGAAMDAAHVLEQTDGFRHRLGQRVPHLPPDVVDLAPHLARDVPGHQVVHLVDARERADRRRGERDIRVDQELLGELDDGAVRPAHMPAGPTLGTKPRDHLDDQVDLIGKQRVEIDEGLGGELRQLDVRGEPRVVGEPPAVLGEEPAQALLRRRVFREHALARNLGDVRGLEVDLGLTRKTVHQSGQLDPLVVEPSHQLGQLFLGGHHDPQPATPDPPQVLDHRLKVQHLLNIAGDELTHLIHHEDEHFARASPLHELQAALGKFPGVDVGPPHRRLPPAVHSRVGGGLERVHHPARLLHGDGDLALLGVPVAVEELLVPGLEGLEPPLVLERDLKLGEIQVARVAEALQEEPVHDLGEGLVARPDPPVRRDVEDHRLGRDLLADVPEQDLHLLIARPLREKRCRPRAGDRAVGER